MESDFIFSGTGPNRRTLKQLLHGEHLDIIIDRFAQMIQSGRDVTLDNGTKVTIYAFIPPTEYRWVFKLLRLHFSSHNTSTRSNSEEIVVQTEHFEVARFMGAVYQGRTLISLTDIEIQT